MKRRSGNRHKWLAASTATLIAEPALAMAHQGGIGVIVGLAVGAAAYALIDDVEQVTGKHLALPARPRSAAPATPNTRGMSSLGYRLLVGKSGREEDSLLDADAPADLEEPEEEESVPEDILELGDLRPHADSVFSNRLAILGMSGAGKSNLVSVTVEELGQYDAPLILFDLKGEYVPLCSPTYLNNPRLASARNVTPENAFETGQKIMRNRFHVIVDLSSYHTDAEAALVMAGLIEGVASWQKARSNAERIPCTLVLEEAHYWLPENEGHSTIRTAKHPVMGVPLLSHLQHTWFIMAKIGRSFGMGLIVATQRPADIDKRIISQAEWRFLLKAMEPADLKVYRAYGLADDAVTQALNPRAGEAFVIGPDGSRGVYHIRRRFSPDVAKSPGLANIRANVNQSPGADVSLTPVTRPASAQEWHTPERHDADADADAEGMRARTPGQPSNVMTFPRSTIAQPAEPNEPALTERQPNFQLTDAEITAFLAAYRACRNRDQALKAIGRGSSNYRECANRILRAYGMAAREEA